MSQTSVCRKMLVFTKSDNFARRIINFRKSLTPNVVFVEKPAETQTSIWLARHLVRAPNS